MLNNRGQSLVLFVLILPIIMLIFVMVIDIGKMILLRQELDNINNIAIDYGLEHLTEENLEIQLKQIIDKNKDDIDTVIINTLDDKIDIELEDTVKLLIIKDLEIFKVKSSYIGYINNDKKIIERNK